MRLDGPLHTREHAPSYYAASQRDKTPFPALSEALEADVCIVGGGLSGVATAVELSEAGMSVVLLEAHRIGWGASGRNGGQVIGSYASNLEQRLTNLRRRHGEHIGNVLWRMHTECVDIVYARAAKYGIECDLKRGYIDVAMKPSEADDLQAWKAELDERGYPFNTRWVPESEIRQIVGSPQYIGGLVNEGYGHVQVLDLCKGEARAAASNGARVFEQSLVTGIERGRRNVVSTEGGQVSAEFVVLCGNAYLRQLTPDLAPSLNTSLFPASSYIIATEPLPEDLANEILPSDYAVCDQRTALDYFRLSADRRLLFGGMSNYTARDPESITDTLGRSMHRVFPQLKDVRVDYEWGGHMGIGINRIPQMGRLGDNIYYMQAYSGHGVAPTHMSARIVSEALRGQAARFDVLAEVGHIRIPGGLRFGQSLLALGMLYYRLRDRFA